MSRDVSNCEEVIKMAPLSINENPDNLLGFFKKLCTESGVEVILADDSWREFIKIRQNFSLHGESINWLIVALYLVWRSKGGPNSGLKLDLLKLLRTVHLGVLEFLSKCNRWMRMSRYDPAISYLVERLIFNQNNANKLFSRYLEIFSLVFSFPDSISEVDFGYNRRKQRKKQVSENELFHFIWILFISSKIFLSNMQSEYINLLHLLNCCFQEVFCAVLMSSSKSRLLNQKFSSLPLDYQNRDFLASEIPLLSATIFSHEPSAFHQHFKEIQNNSWKKFLIEMISRGNMRHNFENPSELLDPDTFSFNLHQLEKFFTDQLQQSNLLDERQFLFCLYDINFNSFSSLQLRIVIDSCRKHLNYISNSSRCSPSKKLSQVQKTEKIKQLGQVFLNYSEFSVQVKKFNNYDTILTTINVLVDELHEKLLGLSNVDQLIIDFEIIRGIFYKLLIAILTWDKKKNSSLTTDNSHMILSKKFKNILLALAIEIYSYLSKYSEFQFPWIVEGISVKVIDFFKVIELVIIADRCLPKSIVKYLNFIEESIISYHAWTTNGDIINIINSHEIIPSLQSAKIPYIKDDKTVPDININLNNLSGRRSNLSITRFNTESLNFDIDDKKLRLMNATKNLFNVNEDKLGIDNVNQSDMPINSQIYASPDVKNQFTASCSSLERENDSDGTLNSECQSYNNSTKSLSPILFFMRKFYRLASNRLMDLCIFLKMHHELRSRCWTCLEYVITNYHKLFENHYLDQLIMCCVYAVGRSSSLNWSFNDILRWYRSKEFCVGEAYRHVLMAPIYRNDGSLVESKEKEFGDLITYYNKVFLCPVNKYLLKLFDKADPNQIELSPLPIIKSLDNFKCQKLASSCQVYISPKKIENIPSDVDFVPIHKFPESPFREFHIINDNNMNSPLKRKCFMNPEEFTESLLCKSPIKIQKIS